MKWVDGGKAIFKVSTNVVSTVYTQVRSSSRFLYVFYWLTNAVMSREFWDRLQPDIIMIHISIVENGWMDALTDLYQLFQPLHACKNVAVLALSEHLSLKWKCCPHTFVIIWRCNGRLRCSISAFSTESKLMCPACKWTKVDFKWLLVVAEQITQHSQVFCS